MKPNRSRDGRWRTTVQITHRLDREQVIALCCERLLMETLTDEVPDSLSRSKIDRLVRDSLWAKGREGGDWWADDVSEGEAEGLLKFVSDEVDRLYPEFGGPR